MTDLDSTIRTEQLANPFRPGNGVAPPYLAGRDDLLGEFERYLGETHPLHANWMRISLQSDHLFRSNPISRFGGFRSPARGAVSAVT